MSESQFGKQIENTIEEGKLPKKISISKLDLSQDEYISVVYTERITF